MILELATIEIKQGENMKFEAALEKAKLVIAQSKGVFKY
jgi:hypothetical protein